MGQWIIKTFVKNYQEVDKAEVRISYGNTASVVGIVINVILFISKLMVGLLANSISITADAINNLTDFSSSIISFWGFKLSSKPADDDHPFGHGRYEYIAGFIVSVLILLIGFGVFRSGLDKILHPRVVAHSIAGFVVMLFSIFIKLWMMYFYKHIGEKISSQMLIATSADSRNDVLTTAGVLLAAVITYISKINLDGYVAVLVSFFIILSGVDLIKDTLNPILGQALDDERKNQLESMILSKKEVLGVHRIYAHDYGPSHIFASVHVEMDEKLTLLHAHKIADEIESEAMEQFGIELTVHVDPVDNIS